MFTFDSYGIITFFVGYVYRYRGDDYILFGCLKIETFIFAANLNFQIDLGCTRASIIINKV